MKEKQFDIILVSGDYHIDHPLNSTGVLKRVLEDNGYSVGIIEKPDWNSDDDFLKLGRPRLFFGVGSGSIDSMLQNYNALLKPRKEQEFSPYDSKVPDRAVIVYTNALKRLFKGVPIVIGGVESSLRRFAHYDYQSNRLRKSILLDSKADLLVFGAGERPVLEIAERLDNGDGLEGIASTCIASSTVPEIFCLLPTFEEVSDDKKAFIRMQSMFDNSKDIAQKTGNKFILQYKAKPASTEWIDYIYSLPYSRNIPKYAKEFKMAQFSIVTHRGCFGNCSFCSISLHFGKKIVSRSEESILAEARRIRKHPDFKGYIDDLGGPSANMYGMDCKNAEFCSGNCISCKKLDRSHKRLIRLMRRIREIKGIKKVFVRSGVRFDLAVDSMEYIKELSEHHISGCLKIAPEHFSESVLKLMNKNNSSFDRFKKIFDKINKPLRQELRYYLMGAHPGEDEKDRKILKNALRKLKNTESVQIFTPTPMSMSTCMFYTEMDPKTFKKISVVKKFSKKKRIKRSLLPPNKGVLQRF